VCAGVRSSSHPAGSRVFFHVRCECCCQAVVLVCPSECSSFRSPSGRRCPGPPTHSPSRVGPFRPSHRPLGPCSSPLVGVRFFANLPPRPGSAVPVVLTVGDRARSRLGERSLHPPKAATRSLSADGPPARSQYEDPSLYRCSDPKGPGDQFVY
jgi:hypothetical protein